MRKNKRNALTYVVLLVITFAIAGIGGIISSKGMPAFDAVSKPSFSPPDIVFPIVWSALYFLMAIGAAMVWNTADDGRDNAILLYAVQLVMNLLWVVWFFALQAYLFSFIWLIALMIAVSAMVKAFYRIDAAAAYLQIPYIAWLTFASVLNFTIYAMNRGG